MADWNTRWMDLANHIATWSKDKSRKVGCVIVNDREILVSMGWNGFPRGVDDEKEDRHSRPTKYLWTEHAERNCIANAASQGVSTLGCKIYIPWYPCMDCARMIVQSGITTVYCFQPDWNDPTYKKDFGVVAEMFSEVNMNVIFLEGLSPIRI